MRLSSVIYAFLGSIQTTKDEECTECFAPEDENECDYFIYPHEIIEFQNGECITKKNKQHKIHLYCLSKWANESPHFKSSKFKTLFCPSCRQDIVPVLLPAFKREILNLRHYEITKSTIKHLNVWRHILVEFPSVARLVLQNLDKNLKKIEYFLGFICAVYPVTSSINVRKIFTALVEYLLKDLEILSIHPAEWDYCKAIRDCSSADILAVYDTCYSKMNNYIKNKFDWLIINLLIG